MASHGFNLLSNVVLQDLLTVDSFLLQTLTIKPQVLMCSYFFGSDVFVTHSKKYSFGSLQELTDGSTELKGHCHQHIFKNSTAQKYVYIIGNLLTVVKFS